MKIKSILTVVAVAIGLGTVAHADVTGFGSATSWRLAQDARNLDMAVRQSYQVDQNTKMQVSYFVQDTQQLNQCMQNSWGPQQCQYQANMVFSRFGQIEYSLQYVNDWRVRQQLQTTRQTIDVLREEMNGGGGGQAYITASPNPCHANGHSLCTTYLRWSVGGWGNSQGVVVTVTSQNEGKEKIFACHEGTGEASWISPNDRYIFKLYKNTQCDMWAVKSSYPIAQLVVRGAP